MATFRVVVGGPDSYSFHWLKDGLPLSNSGAIDGVLSSSLTVMNVLGANSGDYSLVVTNAFGVITSAVARLTVVDPYIVSQPVSQQRDAGQDMEFNVSALGTQPVAYQWWHNGQAMAGAGMPFERNRFAEICWPSSK